MKPPDVKNTFDDCSATVQARLLAFEKIREREEMEEGLL